MREIIAMIFMVLFSVIGGGATVILFVSFPGIIIWKIYRMIKYGYKFTD